MRRATLTVAAITAAAAVVTGCSSSHATSTVPAPTPTAAAVPKPSPKPVVDLSCGHPADKTDKAVPLGPNHVNLAPGGSVTGQHTKVTIEKEEKPLTVGNSFIKDDLDKAQKHAVAVDITVSNVTGEPFHFDRRTFIAVDQDLNCYTGRDGNNLIGSADPRHTDDDPLQGNVGAGKTVKSIVAFEIPDSTTRLTLYVVGDTGTDTDPHPFIAATMAL